MLTQCATPFSTYRPYVVVYMSQSDADVWLVCMRKGIMVTMRCLTYMQ
jgi:hypothetical protein